jgi:hypothetical protein
MSNCCSSNSQNVKHPNKFACPVNGIEYSEVSVRTIAHHIKNAWTWAPTAIRYFFCDDSQCEVVYFGDDSSTILKSQLPRTVVGIKENFSHAPLCYCFGVNKAEYELDPEIKNYVMAQTKAGQCSCETSNPSGRCCLKDFPKRQVE